MTQIDSSEIVAWTPDGRRTFSTVSERPETSYGISNPFGTRRLGQVLAALRLGR